MNPEQFERLMGVIENTGEGAFLLAILYMMLTPVSDLIISFVVVFLGGRLLNLIKFQGSSRAKVIELAQEWDVDYHARETDRILDLIVDKVKERTKRGA